MGSHQREKVRLVQRRRVASVQKRKTVTQGPLCHGVEGKKE